MAGRGFRLRAHTATTMVAVAALLCSCRSAPERVLPILDLACGNGAKIRFEERIRTVNSLAGVNDEKETLLFDGGAGWRVVDQAGHREGPEAFRRLLPPELGFHALPFGEERPRASGRSPWGVFVDPAVVTHAEYDTIVACLDRNLAAIDAAFDTRAGENIAAWPDRRRLLSSIVYAAYDPELDLCGPRGIGPRWECADGKGYLKTKLVEPQIALCTTAPQPNSFFVTHIPNGMTVGAIASDGRGLLLRPPDATTYEYAQLLRDKDWKAYYAGCRDKAGRSVFDTFPEVKD